MEEKSRRDRLARKVYHSVWVLQSGGLLQLQLLGMKLHAVTNTDDQDTTLAAVIVMWVAAFQAAVFRTILKESITLAEATTKGTPTAAVSNPAEAMNPAMNP